MYHTSPAHTDWELTPNLKEYPVTMGGGAMTADKFKDVAIDIASLADKVAFRKCATENNAADFPMSRDCDPVDGLSLKNCVGSASRDCAVNFRAWSRGVLGSFYGLLSKDISMDGFKAGDIFFDQEKVTIVGTYDKDDADDDRKKATMADISKVLIEILMRSKVTKENLKASFDKELWKEAEIKTIEQLYLYIMGSPRVKQISVNRAMLLPASFDMYSHDPLVDAYQSKSKDLNTSGYGLILKLYNLRQYEADYTKGAADLKTFADDTYYTDTTKRLITLKDLPIPDI